MKIYRSDGSLNFFGKMVDGKIDGNGIYYKRNGDIADSIKYKKGALVEWEFFNSADLPFSIAYPNHWISQENLEALFIAVDSKSSDNYKASINIVIASTDSNLSITEVVDLFVIEQKKWIKESSELIDNYKIISVLENSVEYEVKSSGIKYRCRSKIERCNDNVFYALTSIVSEEQYENLEPSIELMHSFFQCK